MIPATEKTRSNQYQEVGGGAFDAAVITVPAHFIRNIEIWDEGAAIQPLGLMFDQSAVFLLMLKFKRDFWRDKANNVGGFEVGGDDAGKRWCR